MNGRSRSPVHPLPLRDPPPPSGLYGRLPPLAGLYGRLSPDILPLQPLDPRVDPHLCLPVDPHTAILTLEDPLVAQICMIQDLLFNYQRLTATYVSLLSELPATERDLLIIATDSTQVHDKRMAEVRAMYERVAKAEEVRAMYERVAKAEVKDYGVEGMREVLELVWEDLVKLEANRDELVGHLRGLLSGHERAMLGVAQEPAIWVEIEATLREILRGRAAVEFEMTVHAGYLV